METKQIDAQTNHYINAQSRPHQRAPEIQPYGTVNHGLEWASACSPRLDSAKRVGTSLPLRPA